MQNYSRLDQLLHRLVLGSPLVSELLFDIERTLFLAKDNPLPPNQTIFVTGLARAGTTTVMRALYASGRFASLTYDDMPFVMAPNLWQKISARNKKQRVRRERAHGDRIDVDFDSPEALEEVFWRSFHGRDYIHEQALVPHAFPAETAGMFLAYQALICRKYQKERYLSKNNNHILRLKSLTTHCKNALILIPFRDPLEQSYSLLRQHRKFQDSTSFVRRYMEWLAHHEFGAAHKPFVFREGPSSGCDPNTLDYWLERWMQAYQYVLDFLIQKPSNLIPVSYERLCKDKPYWAEICRLTNIPMDTPADFSAPIPSELPETSKKLAENTMQIYRQLDRFAVAKINNK